MAEVMTDRELLELAAKAAGLQLCGYSWVSDNENDDECSALESAFVKYHPMQELATTWNPLTEDGDALRLAVKLALDINPYPNTGEVAAIKWVDNQVVNKTFVRCWDDPCAATRRAIVRAAAEIGKGV